MFAVVNIVCMDHTLEVFASLSRSPAQTLVHNNIVENEVEQPIAKNSEAYREHVRIERHLREIIENSN